MGVPPPNPLLDVYDRAAGEGTRLGPRFEPLNIYDAPDVVLSQVLGGVADSGSVLDTILDPGALSPEQRKRIVDRILPEGGALSRTLVGILTNPWIWLGMVTSPVGHAAIAEGRSLFFRNPAINKMARRASGWWSTFFTPLEEFDDVATTVLDVSRKVENLSVETRTMVSPAERVLLERFDEMLGRPGKWHASAPLDPSSYSKGSEEYRIIKRFHLWRSVKEMGIDRGKDFSVYGKTGRVQVSKGGGEWRAYVPGEDEVTQLGGLDIGLERERLRYLREAEVRRVKEARAVWAEFTPKEKRKLGGRFDEWDRPNKREYQEVPVFVEQPARVPQLAILRLGQGFEEAGEQYLNVVGHAKKMGIVRYIGDEAHFESTGGFRVDKEKSIRLMSSLRREMNADGSAYSTMHAGSTTIQGKELLLDLLGDQQFNDLIGRLDETTDGRGLEVFRNVFDGAITKSIGEFWDEPYWAARNTFSAVKVHDGPTAISPVQSLHEVERLAMEEAPWSVSASMSNRVVPLTTREILYNPDDLLDARDLGIIHLTDEGMDHIEKVRTRALEQFKEDGRAVLALRFSGDDGFRRQMRSLHHGTAFDTTAASAAALAEDAEMLKSVPEERSTKQTRMGILGGGTKVSQPAWEGVSNGDLLDRFYQRQMDPVRQKRIREILVPGALSAAGPEYLAVRNAELRSREVARWFAGSSFGRLIETHVGKLGRDLVGRVREISDLDHNLRFQKPTNVLADLFYKGHLGLNMSSIVLQLTQPLILASLVGSPGDVLAAYGTAFKEMAEYAGERASLGAVIGRDKRLELVKKHFEFANFQGDNLLGIGPDPHSMLDSHLVSPTRGDGPSIGDLMLKGFEKAEWFNRSVSAHILKNTYKRAGRDPMTDPHFKGDVHRFVLQTQYGQHDLNTPMLFQKGLLNNPLARQFLSFPLRTLTGSIAVFPHLGGQRTLEGLWNTSVRSMATSALVYEAGKGLFGANLSGGLYASSLTSLVGGDRLLERDREIVPLPPIVSVPVDLLRGVAGGDIPLLSSAIARTIPGGLAINKALGLLPGLPRVTGSGLPGSLQTQYVGWDQPDEQGLVPVYKGDGSLVSMRSPAELIARSFGVDMGAWQTQGAYDGYLVKQRSKILQARHELLMAMGSNETARAISIKRDFQRRYGIPLTVTQAQVTAYLKSRATPRTQRILERMPPDFRALAAPMSPSSVREPPPIDPREVEAMMRRSQVGPAATQEGGSFSSFQSF